MKQMTFFKTFWASFLAFVAGHVILFILSLIVFGIFIAAMSSIGQSTAVVKDNSILEITLNHNITDAPPSSPWEIFNFSSMKFNNNLTILNVLNAIENASVDGRIKGIHLNIDYPKVGTTDAEEIRAALLKFKDSGKFITSYSSGYSQLGYYISSVADSIYLNPQGGMEWNGLHSSVMFYKGLLDKLGVEPQVLRHGSFKAAVEPFIMDKMSPENRLQMTTFTNSIWSVILADISESRKIEVEKLQKYASDLAVYSPEKAVEYGFVDRLVYQDQMNSQLAVMCDKDEDADPEFISLGEYASTIKPVGITSKNKITVIYAEGNIVDGESTDGNVGGNTIAEKLAKARKDDNTKAVVLRINSPGGSAMASEVMWREMELLKKEKPVVVSMGEYAASGGYYIACPADIIVANRTTITGSIGVFGLMFNAEKGLKDKLGISVETVNTNPSADMGSMFRNITDNERTYMMYSIERVYTTFVNHVAQGRNKTFQEIDAIGGGRVWTGANGKEIGLVDGFGGIKEAIALAADRAGVADNYRVVQMSTTEDPFTAIMNSMSEAKTAKMRSELGDAFIHYKRVQDMVKQQGVQATMPYMIEVK